MIDRRHALTSACRLLAALTSQAAAQPAGKPVTIVVPYAAGGGTDTVARLISEHMARALDPERHRQGLGKSLLALAMTSIAAAAWVFQRNAAASPSIGARLCEIERTDGSAMRSASPTC